MKQEITGWVEGIGAKKIFIKIDGDIWQVSVAEKVIGNEDECRCEDRGCCEHSDS